MIKKFIALTLAVMLLSTAAQNTPDVIAQANTELTVTVTDFPTVENNTLKGAAKLSITFEEDVSEVAIVAGIFDGNGKFLCADIGDAFDADASSTVEENFNMPNVFQTETENFRVDFYIWKMPELVPLTTVTSITVKPEAPEIWSGKNDVTKELKIASSQDLEGKYTGYYIIESGADLAAFAQLVNSGENSANAVLTKDIYLHQNTDDLASYTNAWNDYMIGTSALPYKGIFDGNGKNIYGMYMKNVANNQGMFKYVSGATIKDFVMQNVYITSAATGKYKMISPLIANVIAEEATTTSVSGVTINKGKLETAESTYMPNFGSFIANHENMRYNDCRISVTNCHSSIVVDSSNGNSFDDTSTNTGVGGFYGRGKVKIVSSDNSPLVLFENCSFTGTFNVPGEAKVHAFIGRGSDSGTSYNAMTVAKNCTADYAVNEGTLYSETGIGSRATAEACTITVKTIAN